MKRKRIIKNDLTEHTNGESFIVTCSQTDNVYRDGYVSIEQQYKQFIRAGINRMEWLKEAYPSNKTEIHEANSHVMKDAILSSDKYKMGDDLNILDANLRTMNTKNEYEKLYQENKIAQEEAIKQYEIEKRAQELANEKANNLKNE